MKNNQKLKTHFRLCKMALKRICTGRVNRISFKQWFALVTTVVVAVGTMVGAVYMKSIFVKAEAYDKSKKSTTTKVSDNITSTTSIVDERKKQALKDLKDAKEYMSSLGKIELFRGSIQVLHSVEFNDDKGIIKRSAIIEKEALAKYASYLDSSEIEWKISDDGLTLEAYIDRPTIKKEDVERDTSVKPAVIKHPEPGMVDELADKNWIVKSFKRGIANDNVKGYITTEECHELDVNWDVTFNGEAYNKIKNEILSDYNFMRELEDISLSVVENIYNPKIDPTKITDENNVVKKYHRPLNTPVKVFFNN